MVSRWWTRTSAPPWRGRRGVVPVVPAVPASGPGGSTAGPGGEIAAEIEAFRARAAVDIVMLDTLVGMQRIDDAVDGIDDQRRALAELQASLESVLFTAVVKRDAVATAVEQEPDDDRQNRRIADPTALPMRPVVVASRWGPSLAGAVAAAALALSLPLAITPPPMLDPVTVGVAAPDSEIAQEELADARRMLAGLVDHRSTSASDQGWMDVQVAIAEARHAHRMILDLPARTLDQPLIRDEVVAVLAAEDAVLAGLEHAAPEAGRLRAEMDRLRGTLARVERGGIAAVPVGDVIGELETAGSRVGDLVEAVAPHRELDEPDAPGSDPGSKVQEPAQDQAGHLEAPGDRLDLIEPAADRRGLTP